MCGLRLSDTLRLIVLYLQCLVLGAFFGYQALLPILLDEGIFSSYCVNDDCTKQTSILNLMFSLSISALSMSCILWSSLPLKYGPKPNIIIGGTLLSVSYIVFSFGNDWLCFISYIFMAIGCAAMIFGIILIPAQYPNIAGFLYSLIVGFSDVSSGITFIFLTVYTNYDDVSMQTLYLILGILTALISATTYFFIYNTKIFPVKNEENAESAGALTETIQNDDDENAENVDLDTEIAGALQTETIQNDDDENAGALQTETIQNNDEDKLEWKKIFKSSEFILITLWSMCYILTIYFYLMTLFNQLNWITNNDENKVLLFIQVFSIMLFLSGIFSIITGPILDKFDMSYNVCLIGIISIIAAICSVIKIYQLQWITIILFVFQRFYFFATIPLLIIKVFGIQSQRIIYGIILFISGCFNFIAPILANIAITNPYPNFVIINLFTGSLCATSSFAVAFTLFRKKSMQK